MSGTALLVGTLVCATPYVALLVAPATCRRVMDQAWDDSFRKDLSDLAWRGVTIAAVVAGFGFGGFIMLAAARGFGLSGETVETIAAMVGGVLGWWLLRRTAKSAGIK